MTKTCGKCNLEKPISAFYKNARRSDGLAWACKECESLSKKAHYILYKGEYLNRAQIAKKKLQDKIREAKNKPCMDCGVSYPYYVMDFDHREDKEFNIGSGTTVGSWAKIEKEIQKCDVVCSNCHRERTHNRYKARL